MQGGPCHRKFFKSCLPQILLRQFLDTLSHFILYSIFDRCDRLRRHESIFLFLIATVFFWRELFFNLLVFLFMTERSRLDTFGQTTFGIIWFAQRFVAKRLMVYSLLLHRWLTEYIYILMRQNIQRHVIYITFTWSINPFFLFWKPFFFSQTFLCIKSILFLLTLESSVFF